ncbi:hypothetical protein BOX15_Mlig030013g2, partial [Macrostomum lignano]
VPCSARASTMPTSHQPAPPQPINGTVYRSLSEQQLRVLSYLDCGFGALSVLACAAIIGAAIARGRLRHPEVYPVVHLSMADLLATTCLIVSAGLHLTGHNDSQPSLLCAYATGATTALFVCSFGLTLAYAYQVYLRQRTASRMAFEGDTGGGMSDSDGSGGSGGGCDSDKGHWKALAAIGVAWAAPLLAEAGLLAAATAHWSSAGHAHTGGGSGDGIICSSCLPIFRFDQDPCWPADSESASPRMWLKLAFLIPLLCVLLGCCGLYWLAVRHRDLRDRRLGSLTAAQADARRQMRRRVALFIGVFFVSWGPTFVLGSLSLVLSEETADKFFWLYILQAATAPLQGLLNTVVYGWQRRAFLRSLLQQLPRRVSIAAGFGGDNSRYASYKTFAYST